jgi:redox-sensitive bicupin YhaK (pirin superfamily)
MSNSVADLYGRCTDDPADHGRETTVYDAIHAKISPRSEVLRVLPHRERRMVGAWCFVDLYGPRPVAAGAGEAMHVAPHPHTGLQTVSWLVAGEVTHRDSLGTTAQVVPGRVAVMTAGEGIAHAEDVVPPADGVADGVLHGAQLWVALPESERQRPRDFVLHDPAPFLEADGVRARVFLGGLGGVTAGGQGVTPLVGAELTPRGPRPARLPLEPAYEHVLVPLAGSATVEDTSVRHGQAMYLGVDRPALELALSPDARVLLLGGEPFAEEIVMWWNFVARTHDEIEQVRAQWNAGGDARFGEVAHYPTDERLAAPPLPNVRLQPRGRVPRAESPPGRPS